MLLGALGRGAFDNVRTAVVLHLGPADGPRGASFVPCPDGSIFSYCLYTHDDAAGNSAMLGVIVLRAPKNSDPDGQYGGCAPDAAFPGTRWTTSISRKSSLVSNAGKDLSHVIAIDVLLCGEYDGPGGDTIVPCPTGSHYTYCIESHNDGGGNRVMVGVIEPPLRKGDLPEERPIGHPERERLLPGQRYVAVTDEGIFAHVRPRSRFSRSDPQGEYGMGNLNTGVPLTASTRLSGVRSKSWHVRAAGKSMANVTAIDLLDHSGPEGGPRGTFVVPCPEGRAYTYCLESEDDGVGNGVELGVVERPSRLGPRLAIGRAETMGLDSLRQDLRDSLRLQDRSAQESLVVARSLEDSGRYAAALGAYERIRKEGASHKDPSILPAVLLGIGRAHFLRVHLVRAEPFLKQARRLYRARGGRSGAAQALLLMGAIRHWQGHDTEAAYLLQRALQEFEDARDRRGIAETLFSLGEVASAQGRHDAGLRRFEAAQRRFEAIGDRFGAAGAALDRGELYARQEETSQAYLQYRDALRGFERAGPSPISAVVRTSVTRAYEQYCGVADRFDLQPARSPGESYTARQGTLAAWTRMGDVQLERGLFADALSAYRKGLDHYRATGDLFGRAQAHENMGQVYLRQGDDAQALDQLLMALDDYRAADLSHLPTYFVTQKRALQVQLKVGHQYLERGQRDPAFLERALRVDQDALRGYQQLNDRTGTAGAWIAIGQVRLRQGRIQEAAHALQEAKMRLDAVQETGGDPRSTVSTTSRGSPVADAAAIHYQIVLGDLYRKQMKIQAASSAYQKAVAYIERRRPHVAGGEEENLTLFEDYLAPYQSWIQLLLDQRRPVKACDVLERMKARALLDRLQGEQLALPKALTSQERKRQGDLDGQLHALNITIYQEQHRRKRNEGWILRLKDRRDLIRREYREFRIALHEAHPAGRGREKSIPPLTPSEVGQLIPDLKTALLDYLVTDTETDLFVWTRDARSSPRLKVYRQPIGRQALQAKVAALRRLVTARDPQYGRSPVPLELGAILTGPALDQLKGKTLWGIMPDGPLWDLPFQALRSAAGRYLIQDTALFLAPSLTVLREMRRLHRPMRDPASLIIFANPVLEREGKAQIASLPTFSASPMGSPTPLPGMEALGRELVREYGLAHSRAYVGPQATEEAFKRETGRYRIVFFGTHGFLDDTDPLYSFLLMSQAGGSPAEDGFLEAWEIAGANLNADLVVLAACETGRGEIRGGEGVIGMAWAWLAAGCPRIVVSQWKVQEAPTQALIEAFFRHLRRDSPGKRVSFSEALRRAELQLMRRRGSHPFDWAGFVLMGDGLSEAMGPAGSPQALDRSAPAPAHPADREAPSSAAGREMREPASEKPVVRHRRARLGPRGSRASAEKPRTASARSPGEPLPSGPVSRSRPVDPRWRGQGRDPFRLSKPGHTT